MVTPQHTMAEDIADLRASIGVINAKLDHMEQEREIVARRLRNWGTPGAAAFLFMLAAAILGYIVPLDRNVHQNAQAILNEQVKREEDDTRQRFDIAKVEERMDELVRVREELARMDGKVTAALTTMRELSARFAQQERRMDAIMNRNETARRGSP